MSETITVSELKEILNDCNDNELIYYYDDYFDDFSKPRIGRVHSVGKLVLAKNHTYVDNSIEILKKPNGDKND